MIAMWVVFQNLTQLLEFKILQSRNHSVVYKNQKFEYINQCSDYEIEYILLYLMPHLHNCICSIFFPPLDHVGPHLLCFLNIKLPCFQESARNVLDSALNYKKKNMQKKIMLEPLVL